MNNKIYRMLNKISNKLNGKEKTQFDIAKIHFSQLYEKLPIEENTIIVQSYNGDSISGNPYHLMKKIAESEEYSNYKIYAVTNWKNYTQNKKFLDEKKFRNVEIVKIHTKKYARLLASAKYLINNATFPPYFIKRKEQVYLNTWHGTPLKNMGRKIKSSPNELGNTQRNILMADYFLSPNDFTFEIMKRDYMLDNLYKGKYVIGGYPRNSAFFNDELRQSIIKEYKLENKKVVMFMPTWRGVLDNLGTDEQVVYLKHSLYEIEKNVNDDTVVFVKLHNYSQYSIDFSKLKKVRPFSSKYETYEFLNVADCLITDYSSVMFDFAVTGRKVVLYCYDAQQYLEERGMYLDFYKLPFRFATTETQLISEINNVNDYEPYSDSIKEYVKYDNPLADKYLCDLLLQNKKCDELRIIDGEEFSNGKKNILLFTGALLKNGITTALRGLINNIDKDKYNYYALFEKTAVQSNKENIAMFNDIGYIAIQGQPNKTEKEQFYFDLYNNYNFDNRITRKVISDIYKREVKRIFPNLKFDYVIHYSGYERFVMHLFSEMDAEKIIFTHSDMSKEIKTRNNIHIPSLKKAYDNFDKIVVIRKSMENGIKSFYKGPIDNKIAVVHNFNDIETIRKNALNEPSFDPDTYCNVSIKTLKNILNNNNVIKFINIARFSPEKGLDQLVYAFNRFGKDNPDSYLIIVGGHGDDFDYINGIVQSLETKNIIIIKSISNPYAILAKCDCFVLSSHYEGLPMTIMEALILDKKVICTNITGPKEFLSNGYGYIVDDSEDGLIAGMKEYADNGLKNLVKFDAEEFNKRAVVEYERLLEE